MDKRISVWMNKYLSFAGRLQLIRYVLSSLHVYWSSVIFLPSRVIADLEQKMRKFLWGNNDHTKYHAKVAWKIVCLPKSEGGLRIRRISDMNKALMVLHIWRLIQNQDSLWVKWIHTVRLRGRLTLADNVDNIVHDGRWAWPEGWMGIYPQLASINLVIHSDVQDQICWKVGGSFIPFSAANS
ncbi:hypothetical protein QVD17_06841 [Tagetes erecta]|uniref:Uncharacterized protein n=1 Tax=Tagetes erecta TaxID=13708 RepID=A0AAD8LEC9_TARER|nr:hypothetical protein QVD17_06841 [Tagetes erecta]